MTSGRLDFVDPHLGGGGLARTYAPVAAEHPCPLSGASALDPPDVPALGRTLTWSEMLELTSATSCVVLNAGQVVYEWYAEGVGATSLLLGASMTKSALATLCGRAVTRGDLDLDTRVTDLVPELVGTGYATCRVRDIAAMTTGTAWVEDHRDPDGPAVRLVGAFRSGAGRSRDLLSEVGADVGPGLRWEYSTADSQVLDWCREAATGVVFVDALAQLWQVLGCEHDAVVGLDRPDGVALAGGGVAATARDWAQMGRLQVDGTCAGERVLSDDWLDVSSTPTAPFTRPGRLPDAISRHLGFGLHWWPLDPRGRRVVADGMRGQFTLVDRDRDVVVVKTSGWPHASVEHDRSCRDLTLLALQQVADAAAG